MKFLIVFVALFAVALAAPGAPSDAEAVILKSESEVLPESFSYAVETNNGISAQQQGQLQNVGTDDEGIAVQGSYSFEDPEGKKHTINYIADKNGYQPQGEDVPVAPVA